MFVKVSSLLTCLHIFVVNSDIGVTVVAAVLVVEANGVHELVDDRALVHAAVRVQGDPLLASDGAHVRPAATEGQRKL